MKKVSILAAIALVAVGCNKKTFEEPILPVTPDAEAPVSFGASANVSVVESKAATILELGKDLTPKLGVYAFKAAAVPANNTSNAATDALWSAAANLQYNWVADATNAANSCYKQDGTATLFWPGSGTTGSNLSFASYFPYLATAATGNGVNEFVLTQDLSDQSAAPDYGFAWAKLENVARPNPVAAKELNFNYKVAKITLSIVGDGSTVGASGITVQPSGNTSAAGIQSVKIYGAGNGLYKTYKLDLLTGATTGSTGNLTSADKMTLKGGDKAATGTAPFTNSFVEAVGYLAPSANNSGIADGITVEIVYHDGTTAQTYSATLKAGVGNTVGGSTSTLSGDAAFANGLEAGKNYKYTLKLGKSGITFTGKVTDWEPVDGGEIDLQ